MLKAAVVGGPSLVFTRTHVAGGTRIRSHKYDLARIVKRILGFDANSLYPSTMAKEMPCGKEFVEHYEDPAQAARELIPKFTQKGSLALLKLTSKFLRICGKSSKSSHPSS